MQLSSILANITDTIFSENESEGLFRSLYMIMAVGRLWKMTD
jgi:hypothetical protein